MHPTRTPARTGFSLLEMMLVLLIMSTLVTIVVVNVVGRGEKARRQTTGISMKQIEAGVKEYHVDNGYYPVTAEGGLALLEPDYLERIPRDGWGRPFQYYSPTLDENIPYEIISAGPDGSFETQQDNIYNWALDR